MCRNVWHNRGTGRGTNVENERVHTCFVEHACRGPCSCVCVCVYAASWAAFCFSMVNQGSPSRDWVHHEISPADIPAFLSIYKDLYERAMDTLSSLSPPPPTRDQPRGGPRGPGSTSLWPRERENKAWSRQAWGVEGGGVEDPGRWGPTKGNRRGSARRASGLRVFGT